VSTGFAAGPASAPLSDFTPSGASTCGTSVATGNTFCATSRGEKTGGRYFAGRDDNARTHLGPIPHLLGKRHRHADAAMRGRIAGNTPACIATPDQVMRCM